MNIGQIIDKLTRLMENDIHLTRKRLEGNILHYGFKIVGEGSSDITIQCPQTGHQSILDLKGYVDLYKKSKKEAMEFSDHQKGTPYVYLLVLGDDKFKAGYIGSSRNIEKRVYDHVRWLQQEVRSTRHLWSMADAIRESVYFYILEEYSKNVNLRQEEGLWQSAFEMNSHNLPAIEKWRASRALPLVAMTKDIPEYENIKEDGLLLRFYKK